MRGDVGCGSEGLSSDGRGLGMVRSRRVPIRCWDVVWHELEDTEADARRYITLTCARDELIRYFDTGLAGGGRF